MNNTAIRETVKVMMGMSQPQLDYAAAKALYHTVKARADAEKKAVHEAHNRHEITVEQWAEQTTDIEYRLGYWKAFDALIVSEKVLIAWAQDLMQSRRPQDYGRVKEAFEKRIYNEELRQKLVDLCFRLKASTV